MQKYEKKSIPHTSMPKKLYKSSVVTGHSSVSSYRDHYRPTNHWPLTTNPATCIHLPYTILTHDIHKAYVGVLFMLVVRPLRPVLM